MVLKWSTLLYKAVFSIIKESIEGKVKQIKEANKVANAIKAGIEKTCDGSEQLEECLYSCFHNKKDLIKILFNISIGQEEYSNQNISKHSTQEKLLIDVFQYNFKKEFNSAVNIIKNRYQHVGVEPQVKPLDIIMNRDPQVIMNNLIDNVKKELRTTLFSNSKKLLLRSMLDEYSKLFDAISNSKEEIQKLLRRDSTDTKTYSKNKQILLPRAIANKYINGLKDDLIRTNNISSEDIKSLNKLSKDQRVEILKQIIVTTADNASIHTLVNITDYVLEALIKKLNLTRKARSSILLALWKNRYISNRLLFFMFGNSLKSEDLNDMNSLLKQCGIQTGDFLIPIEIWEDTLGEAWDEKGRQVQRELHKCALLEANKSANKAMPDNDFETARLLVELIREFNWINNPFDPSFGSGPYLCDKIIESIDYRYDDWTIQKAIHLVGRLAITFTRKGHWATGRKCLKYLAEICGETKRTDNYFKRIIDIMGRLNAPVHWIAVTTLDYYDFVDDCSNFLMLKKRKDYLTRVGDKLSTYTKTLAHQNNGNKNLREQFIVSLLIERIREFAWNKVGLKIDLSDNEIKKIINNRIKFHKYYLSIRWYEEASARNYIDLINDYMKIYPRRVRKEWIEKMISCAFSDYSSNRHWNNHTENRWREIMWNHAGRQLQDCVYIIDNLGHRLINNVDNDLIRDLKTLNEKHHSLPEGSFVTKYYE
ncbi:MAG: hypothetical protein ACFFDT_39705 [Candidatus Hodarchaeota archaeon]